MARAGPFRLRWHRMHGSHPPPQYPLRWIARVGPVLLSGLALPLVCLAVIAAQTDDRGTFASLPEGTVVHRDLVYVPGGHERHKLDLYLPREGVNLPLLINIHGGAFRMGSKEAGVPLDYLAEGFAIASINYRLSHHAIFPAQIEDCKAAVRWLRAHADKYRLDPNRFAAWGASAGGHLAAMLGTTGDTTELDVGAHLDQPSRVQAVVDYFGPTDFLQMDAHRLPNGQLHDPADSPESLLIGGPIQENKARTARANPIQYVTAGDPPFLICHGDQDPLVPHHQSQLLAAALKQAGVPVTFYTVTNGGHGRFSDPKVGELTREFLTKQLKRQEQGLALPTPVQAAWHDYEIGMFIHFAPNTWFDQEYDDLSKPPSEINPTALDTDQWVRVAESMGAKYLVFVAKHVGGFCWWQTETSDYGVKQTPWRSGKGDLVSELAASCRKRNMHLGVYLSPADRHHGVGVGGKADDPIRQSTYERIFREQLTELLSRYGEMKEVWFDGSLVFDVGDILRQHAPGAVVFQGPQASIRWVGNEDGVAPYPAWNAVRKGRKPWGTYTAADGDPDGDRWLPNECDARMRNTWFWRTDNLGSLKTVDQLMQMYLRSVGHGAVLLLNNTPDPTGLIPAPDAARSAEFGRAIERRFGTPIIDTAGSGPEALLMLSAPRQVGTTLIMEDITHGERIRKYVVEGKTQAGWSVLATGTAVGHKKVDVFEPVEVTELRLRIEASTGKPIIRKFAAFGE